METEVLRYSPLTFEQAKGLKLGQILHESHEYNTDGSCRRWRVNGKVKLWKRSPERIEIPIKHGLRDYSYITERGIRGEWFHLPGSCNNPKGR